ncbi:MAG: hypothetical protein R3B47_03645 [Bacteroidia bacterium]
MNIGQKYFLIGMEDNFHAYAAIAACALSGYKAIHSRAALALLSGVLNAKTLLSGFFGF